MFREPNRWIRLLRTGPGQDSRPVAAGVIHMTSARGGPGHTSVIELVSSTVLRIVPPNYGGSP